MGVAYLVASASEMALRSTAVLLAAVMVLMALTSAAPSDEELCPMLKKCLEPLEYSYECGISDEGIPKTFLSQCHREMWSQCRNTYYVLAYEGAC